MRGPSRGRLMMMRSGSSTGSGTSGVGGVNTQQNLLAQVAELESSLATTVGEPVEVVVTKAQTTVKLGNGGTTITVAVSSKLAVRLLTSGITLGLTLTEKYAGTPAP